MIRKTFNAMSVISGSFCGNKFLFLKYSIGIIVRQHCKFLSKGNVFNRFFVSDSKAAKLSISSQKQFCLTPYSCLLLA